MSLFQIEKEVYDKVVHELYKKHHCYLPDCYEHPEYLNDVLKGLYGNAHNVIVGKIKKQLEEFSYQQPVERFLKVISHE